jgi:hypothetical protein
MKSFVSVNLLRVAKRPPSLFFFSNRPRGRYVSKLPRRRNSPISRATQAAVHEERRVARRQQQVQQLRQREIDDQPNQQARQAAINAAIQEAERILQIILAERE